MIVFCILIVGRAKERNIEKKLKQREKVLPVVGISSPVSILKDVVFPAPLIPSKPKHSPDFTPKLRPRTARKLKMMNQNTVNFSLAEFYLFIFFFVKYSG